MESPSPSFLDIMKLFKQLTAVDIEYWTEQVVFSFEWWLLVGIFLIPWIVWWKSVAKGRLFEISTFGSIILIIAMVLDAIGVKYCLWNYPYRLTPLMHPALPFDLSVIPVTYMLLYQYLGGWKKFAIGTLLTAFVFAFVAEPLLVMLNLYQPLHWSHSYSLPIYFLLPLFVKWVVEKMKGIQATG